MGGDADEGMDRGMLDAFGLPAGQEKGQVIRLSPSALVRAPATLYESQEGCIEES